MFLDALSVAYWTEKIGSQFDTPIKMEVTWKQKKKDCDYGEITRKQQGLSEERIKKKN